MTKKNQLYELTNKEYDITLLAAALTVYAVPCRTEAT